MEEVTFLAIIPARAGSKRLPKKNILSLKGKPLISWSIESSLNSKYINKVVVSTDDSEVIKISNKVNVDVVKRPCHLATDTASMTEVITHCIEEICCKYKYIILLQPTSPLRKTYHIDEAIELLLNKNADAVISVSQMEHSPLWSNKLPANKSMNNFLSKEIIDVRSQDLEPYYRINGAIYICKTDLFLKQKTFFLEDNIFAYEMDKKYSIDIDEEFDFKIADLFMENN